MSESWIRTRRTCARSQSSRNDPKTFRGSSGVVVLERQAQDGVHVLEAPGRQRPLRPSADRRASGAEDARMWTAVGLSSRERPSPGMMCCRIRLRTRPPPTAGRPWAGCRAATPRGDRRASAGASCQPVARGRKRSGSRRSCRALHVRRPADDLPLAPAVDDADRDGPLPATLLALVHRGLNRCSPRHHEPPSACRRGSITDVATAGAARRHACEGRAQWRRQLPMCTDSS